MTKAQPRVQTPPSSAQQYRYLESFTLLFVVVLLISNLIAPKFFAIGPMRISAAQILFPITYIFGDIFTEVYGYGASRRAISYAVFCLKKKTTTKNLYPPVVKYGCGY